jgi:hypothetical protein
MGAVCGGWCTQETEAGDPKLEASLGCMARPRLYKTTRNPAFFLTTRVSILPSNNPILDK